ncbi:MAG: imidazoleglycerol-phosphate dehydratase HisB [bacterium]|nr:imidazoleglycerol-phosphate dehydratase HisB [bacterium]
MGPEARGGEFLSARKAGGGRRAEVRRQTSETDFTVSIDLDGAGKGSIATGIGFFDHMLNQIARHGLIDITVKGKGDLEVDAHHTAEDVGILLGQAIAKALGDRAGIHRFADVRLPMMDALAHVVIDAGGRGNLVYSARYPEARVGALDAALVREFFWSVATHAGIDLHIEVCYGENTHHMVEAVFKAFARAMRDAVALDPREPGVPSTKGVL